MKFSEVQKKSHGLEQFFSKFPKKTVEVLQGFYRVQRFHSVPSSSTTQDSLKFEMVFGSSRFSEAPRASTRFTLVLQGSTSISRFPQCPLELHDVSSGSKSPEDFMGFQNVLSGFSGVLQGSRRFLKKVRVDDLGFHKVLPVSLTVL